MAYVSLIYTARKKKTKKWGGNKKVKTDMLRSIGKQSGKSVESVPRKKKKAMLEMICRNKRL